MEIENYELFTLIWLDDSTSNVEKKLSVQQKLRSTIYHVKNFQDEYQCEDFIRNKSSVERIILIVSGKLGIDFVPRIFKCQSIASIYVFCADRAKHLEWTNQYCKIRAVVTQLDQLVNQIEYDQSRRYRCKIDDPILISIFEEKHRSEELSIGRIDYNFVYSQIFLDYMFGFEAKSKDRSELNEFLRDQYRENQEKMNEIHQFQNDYSSKHALWWYTQNSILYKVLNKSLLTKRLKTLLMLRFFVNDLDCSLKELKCQSGIRVYRAQTISNDELEILKHSIGQLISINSFLWTNLIRKSALSNLKEFSWLNESSQSILFEIDADFPMNSKKTFANITAMSYFKGEQEILFMIGSIFRITDISYDANRFWLIRLKLVDRHEKELISIEHFRQQQLLEPLNFGYLLIEMKIFDQAEAYFHHLLKESTDQKTNKIASMDALGQIALEKKNFDDSLNWHEKALKLKKQMVKPNDITLASSYNNLALVYLRKEDFTNSIEFYQIAFNIFKENLSEDDPQVSNCLNNIALVYRTKRDYMEALKFYEKTLSIHRQYLAHDHPDIGMSLMNIAMIYGYLSLYEQALEYYHQAVEIYEQILSPPHALLGLMYENVGNIHYDREDFDRAMLAYENAAYMYQKLLPSTNCDFLQIQMAIRRLNARFRYERKWNKRISIFPMLVDTKFKDLSQQSSSDQK